MTEFLLFAHILRHCFKMTHAQHWHLTERQTLNSLNSAVGVVAFGAGAASFPHLTIVLFMLCHQQTATNHTSKIN